MIDLDKLTPSPWVCDHHEHGSEPVCSLESGFTGFEANAEFIALARNAFDVMMRRGWGVVHTATGWWPALPEIADLRGLRKKRWPDPFTALVEADKWYRENVENKT